MAENDPAEKEKGPRLSPVAWVLSSYFAEGFPYSIVNNGAETLFQEMGAGRRAVGLTALLHLPWNLKFLWGPFVDRHETKRRWLIGTEVVLTGLLVALAFAATTGQILAISTVVFLAMAFVSATHDIAIDGYYLEALDEKGQSTYVGFRAAAYRWATLLITGPLIVIVADYGWAVGWAGCTVLMAGLLLFHRFFLPKVETKGLPIAALVREAMRPRVLIVGIVVALLIAWQRQTGALTPIGLGIKAFVSRIPFLGKLDVAGWIGVSLLSALLIMLALLPVIRKRIEHSKSSYAKAFLHFLEQPKVGRILAFVILFRTGESFLMKQRLPFLREEVALTLKQYGWINGTAGFLMTSLATLLGGYLIGKHGLRRWLWPFVIAQNSLNLLYMLVAMQADPSSTGIAGATAVILAEHFGAGLGTAVFMVYIMRCCDPRHKAAHMAIVTALMSVGFTLAGAASGFLSEALGSATFFGLTFVATIPSMVLIFFIPHLDGRES